MEINYAFDYSHEPVNPGRQVVLDGMPAGTGDTEDTPSPLIPDFSSKPYEIYCGDAPETIRGLKAGGTQFDTVITSPPYLQQRFYGDSPREIGRGTGRGKVCITQQDWKDFLSGIPDASVDVCVTDPPYWTLDKWRNIGSTTRLGGNRDKSGQRPEMFYETIGQDEMVLLVGELERVLKHDGHLYLFCDDIVAPMVLLQVRNGKMGFEDAHQLIWNKMCIGMGYHYRRSYECIVFAWKKGKRRLANLGTADILTHKRVAGGYPTEKPVALVQELVAQSVRPGNTVIDPFAGSGVLAAACPQELGCNILLGDKSPEAVAHMSRRLGA